MLPSASQNTRQSGLWKLALDFGPLLLFFLANWRFGLMTATALFMASSVAAVSFQWLRERKLPVMPLIALAIVLFFGGLTLFLADERFIKMKPTFVYGAFAIILAAGLMARRFLLKHLLGAAFYLDDAGWRILSWRWIGFFIAMGLLNEALWRSLTTDQWISFKTFGSLLLTLIFIALQAPLLRRHGAKL